VGRNLVGSILCDFSVAFVAENRVRAVSGGRRAGNLKGRVSLANGSLTRYAAKHGRQLPVMLTVRLVASNPNQRSSKQCFDPDKDERGSGERREQRRLRQLPARRQSRKLSLNDLQLAFDGGDVGSV